MSASAEPSADVAAEPPVSSTADAVELEDPAHLRAVRPLLRDPHPEVRATAAELVAELSDADD